MASLNLRIVEGGCWARATLGASSAKGSAPLMLANPVLDWGYLGWELFGREHSRGRAFDAIFSANYPAFQARILPEDLVASGSNDPNSTLLARRA